MELTSEGIIASEKLLPTDETAHYHGLRVHHQIMTWLFLEESATFDPLDWGWQYSDGVLTRIMNYRDVAPTSVTSVIRCNCQMTTKNPCGTGRCTCYNYGVPCLLSCSGCRGEDCHNKNVNKKPVYDDEDSSDDEDCGDRDYDNIFDILNSQFNSEE